MPYVLKCVMKMRICYVRSLIRENRLECRFQELSSIVSDPKFRELFYICELRIRILLNEFPDNFATPFF